MAFNLKRITHLDLVKEMEASALAETGIVFQFNFELASDGNTDLFIEKPSTFTRSEVEKLVHCGWLNSWAFEELEGDTDLHPFELDDELSQSHALFHFVLEKTYGKSTHVAGLEDVYDCILLNIAIPA